MAAPISRTKTAAPLRAGSSISADAFHALRRRMVLNHCKWDPQVGDVSTLAAFPLLMSRAAWDELALAAEQLTRETSALEGALLERPDLHARLGMRRSLRRVFRSASRETLTPAAARVMRFDFHPTADGWRVSEVNSDVPGGFTEASALSTLMAQHVENASPAGDPGGLFADTIAAAADGGAVALLSAPGFMEDQQVVANLARLLNRRGCKPFLAQPHHLQWHGGRAHIQSQLHRGPVAVIVRFYQGEWLARLPRRVASHHLFVGGQTPVANPGIASLSESKRLPLLWDELGLRVDAWRRYLPETREPRDAPWRRDDSWLLKTAYCNTGDSVTMRDLVPARRWRKTLIDVALSRHAWLAQRRFDAVPIDTPQGAMFPCIGVYTIDGRACGAYARLSPQPLIKYDAIDAAVLIVDDNSEAMP